ILLFYVSDDGILVGFVSYKTKNKYIATVGGDGITAIFACRRPTICAFNTNTYTGNRSSRDIRVRNSSGYCVLLLLNGRYLVSRFGQAGRVGGKYSARQ